MLPQGGNAGSPLPLSRLPASGGREGTTNAHEGGDRCWPLPNVLGTPLVPLVRSQVKKVNYAHNSGAKPIVAYGKPKRNPKKGRSDLDVRIVGAVDRQRR